jgi:CBS domain-containing protein
MTKKKALRIRDVMTSDPLTLEASSTVFDAARAMKAADIGPIPVLDQAGNVCGIITDRDVVVRVIAEGRDPTTTKLGDICSQELTVLSPDDSVDEAVRLMRERALRRFPVVEGGKAVGIVSIGDIAVEREPDSALADISGAPPNE